MARKSPIFIMEMILCSSVKELLRIYGLLRPSYGVLDPIRDYKLVLKKEVS